MKKTYNQPEFVVVEMMPQTIICASATKGGTTGEIPVSGTDPIPGE